MQLISKEIILSHLQRAEGAEEVTLPIDFFRDLLYQAMPQQRTWVGLTDEEIWQLVNDCTIGGDLHANKFSQAIEAKLKEKNT
jgi:hypothetical protein